MPAKRSPRPGAGVDADADASKGSGLEAELKSTKEQLQESERKVAAGKAAGAMDDTTATRKISNLEEELKEKEREHMEREGELRAELQAEWAIRAEQIREETESELLKQAEPAHAAAQRKAHKDELEQLRSKMTANIRRLEGELREALTEKRATVCTFCFTFLLTLFTHFLLTFCSLFEHRSRRCALTSPRSTSCGRCELTFCSLFAHFCSLFAHLFFYLSQLESDLSKGEIEDLRERAAAEKEMLLAAEIVWKENAEAKMQDTEAARAALEVCLQLFLDRAGGQIGHGDSEAANGDTCPVDMLAQRKALEPHRERLDSTPELLAQEARMDEFESALQAFVKEGEAAAQVAADREAELHAQTDEKRQLWLKNHETVSESHEAKMAERKEEHAETVTEHQTKHAEEREKLQVSHPHLNPHLILIILTSSSPHLVAG